MFLDSGGGSLPQRVDDSHLQWLVEENAKHLTVPVMAFCHIPTQEFQFTNKCMGENNDGGIAPLQDGDAGLISTLKKRLVQCICLGCGP